MFQQTEVLLSDLSEKGVEGAALMNRRRGGMDDEKGK